VIDSFYIKINNMIKVSLDIQCLSIILKLFNHNEVNILKWYKF